MQLVCLDLEGVLVPEIWIEFAQRTGIAELRRTTRDEPDYDKLMKYRLDLLRQKPDIASVWETHARVLLSIPVITYRLHGLDHGQTI